MAIAGAGDDAKVVVCGPADGIAGLVAARLSAAGGIREVVLADQAESLEQQVSVRGVGVLVFVELPYHTVCSCLLVVSAGVHVCRCFLSVCSDEIAGRKHSRYARGRCEILEYNSAPNRNRIQDNRPLAKKNARLARSGTTTILVVLNTRDEERVGAANV